MAGTTFATDLLYAVFVRPCDILLASWPELNLGLVVDDLSIQALGSPNDTSQSDGVVKVASGAARQAKAALEGLGCVVSAGEAWASEGKTVTVCSDGAVLARATISLRAMGIADDIVNLAFGLTLGAVAVAIALSFGLGGREAAGRQMEAWLSKLRKD